MVQEKEQTHDKKVSMYMKLSKRELIEMIIECNNVFSRINSVVYFGDEKCSFYFSDNLTGMNCKFCGRQEWEH